MQKRTREIIALVMLIVLGIAGVSAMAWYILVGHNWNATATRIDDRIGNMDGYTVVLCEGSVPAPDTQLALSAAQPMLEEQNLGIVEEGGESGGEPIVLQDAIDSYLEKGAQVVTVLCDDPRYYADPVIVPRNGRRIAIFSVSGPRSDLAARTAIKSLRKHDVDFTVCLCSDVDSLEGGIAGLDLAVCYDFDAAGLEGRYLGSTYVMGIPYEGQVGAVIVAPSGFLTSKMIDVA